MTPKFDNLASLLMEMPKGVPLTPDERLEIAEYIDEFEEATYPEIAAAFGLNMDTVALIAKQFNVGRYQKGEESHKWRKLSNAQEEQVLDYWLANHYETTYPDLVRWIKQQFGVEFADDPRTVLKRAAEKHNKRLPPGDKGKGTRLKKQRDTHRHATDPTDVPTSRSHHFKGSTGIVPSNPKHGGPAHPPNPPIDQDKRL
jgi:transposase